MANTVKPYVKYSTDELMEVVDVFNVSQKGLADIRAVLEREEKVPDAGNFFRYYNPRSKVDLFEKQVAAKIGSKHVLAVNSGTSALVASLVAAGVRPGDEVIIPAYTFFASASAVVVAKAIPVIVEIDETLTLDPVAVEKAITSRTRAILPVHMLGLPSKMDELRAIAKKYEVVLIEDTAQAFGGKYKGQYLGTIGDIGCISLDAYKVIGTGEGGLVLTNDEWMYTKAQSYHDAAACWRPDRFARERKPGELFCGENYRMPEMCAAVGIAQLKKLDWICDHTRAAWKQLRTEVKLPSCAKWIKANDEDGVCGYSLGIMFENNDQATKAITGKIGLGGLAAGDTKGVRDWHVYWNWEHILEQKTATPEGCPFKCPHVGKLPDYRVDMCPNTRDIMRRLATLAIMPDMTPESTAVRATQLTADLKKLF
ncbi:MAG: DegT/DnrJ/EryC1/StrS family aminotransferase [bacterium]